MTATRPTGTRTRLLRERLRRHEPPGMTWFGDRRPIVWESARGAHVRDADGRRYLDLTAAFGVAAVGHAHPAVVEAVRRQAGELMHAMADVSPSRVKVELLEELAGISPGDLDAAYLGLSGADGVEAALKTAALVTGRPRAIAFEGAYHGLSYGALAVCGRRDFRAPFREQLGRHAILAPYPSGGATDATAADLAAVEWLIARPEVGAVIVEPIQGRAGIRLPVPGFLPALRAACDRHGVMLIADEVWTGLGRAGAWFAIGEQGVVPDLLVVGKALGGGVPISAVVGRRRRMGDWAVGGEALHTATFSGHPLAAAAARAVLRVLRDEGLVERSASLGASALDRLRGELEHVEGVADVRGRGLMIGIELRRADGLPDAGRTAAVLDAALDRGLLVLGGGEAGHVLELTPPLVIDRDDLDAGIDILCDLVRSIGPGAGR